MIELGKNPTLEYFSEPFKLSGTKITSGLYKFNEYFVLGNSNNSRRLSGSVRWSTGRFYSGYKHSYVGGTTFRANYKLSTSFSYTYNNISLAEVTRVEVASALARREREGSLTAAVRARLLTTVEAHCAARYRLVPTEHHVVDLAVDLVSRHRLRAYDAIQLATAIVLGRSLLQYGLPSPIFVSADDELLLAAGAEGLQTENPNLHP